MTIDIEDLAKVYADGTVAVNGLTLSVKQGEFVSLLGPSGCGKTSTLRLVAGIEEPSSGRIRIKGRDVTDRPPGDRDIAMVFQNYALYPHMSVYENLTLNLKVARVPRAEIAARARETAKLLDIEALLAKKPGKLSGGQRQRVALGRAIIRQPAAFLMDEPLSNLDVKLREHMRTEIKLLHRRLATTTLYVTHDQAEAMTMSDRIAVMNQGALQQVGTPDDVYNHPTNLFVAEFIGSPGINLISVADFALGRGVLGAIPCNLANRASKLVFGVRPEDVLLEAPGDAALRGTIDFVEPVGAATHVFIRLDGTAVSPRRRDRLIATVDAHQRHPAGSYTGIRFRTERLHVFDAASGEALVGGLSQIQEPHVQAAK
jgi:sn-glycerol 3-phosphate transport system ATP-binding protein